MKSRHGLTLRPGSSCLTSPVAFGSYTHVATIKRMARLSRNPWDLIVSSVARLNDPFVRMAYNFHRLKLISRCLFSPSVYFLTIDSAFLWMLFHDISPYIFRT